MKSLGYVYLIQHCYNYEFEGEQFEKIKTIGIFSTMEKAVKVIGKIKSLPGFKDHPLECFQIDKYKIDEITGWSEGFFIY